MGPSNICRRLRAFCLKHEWLQSLSASTGLGLLVLSVWFILEAQGAILAWVNRDLLFHGVSFAVLLLADVLLVLGLLALGFSECTDDERHCLFAYRGRRSRVHPKALNWMESLGSNPRRRPRRSA
jgi:hypothetical protein